MKVTLLGLIMTLGMLQGCATVTEAGYYWGDYSDTLYKYTKDPNKVTLANHFEELENIIKVSREKSLRVPPGVHAELGYIMARQGDDVGSIVQYENEMALYPESRIFLERLQVENNKGSDKS